MSLHSKPKGWLFISSHKLNAILLEQRDFLINRAFGLARPLHDLRNRGSFFARYHGVGIIAKLRSYPLFLDKLILARLTLFVSRLPMTLGPIRFAGFNDSGGIYGPGSPLTEFDDLTRVAAKK